MIIVAYSVTHRDHTKPIRMCGAFDGLPEFERARRNGAGP